MKKLLLSIVIVLFSIRGHGQETKFGIKGGMNLSLFGNDVRSKVGFQVGGFSKIKLAESWYVQPEILYMVQSVERDNVTIVYQGFSYTGSGAVKMSYLFLPVVFQYYPMKFVFVESGLQVGILLAANAKALDLDRQYEMDVKDEFKKVDFGFNIGTGYEFNDQLSLAIRYYVGITKMANSEYVRDFYNRNSILSLSAAYSF